MGPGLQTRPITPISDRICAASHPAWRLSRRPPPSDTLRPFFLVARVTEFDRSRNSFRITTDVAAMDVDAVHAYLVRSYWAEGIPRELLVKAMAGSLCFGLLDCSRQVGFARVVTDRATYAYLCDVYVLEEYRGRGLGSWMMREVMAHPELQGLRRFGLVTRDAHGLYEKCGFTALNNPAGHMEITWPGLYLAGLGPKT